MAEPDSALRRSAMFCGTRALRPVAVTRKLMVSPSPIGSTVSTPPRGIVCCAMTSMLSRSLTRFFGKSRRGKFQVMVHLPSSIWPFAMLSASPRSICAPEDPAAPKASRQNCSRADAVFELLRINSSAKSRSSGLLLSSSTSSALTMAPTGLIRSWQTREQSSAASSRASGAGPDDDVPDIGFSQNHTPAAWWRAANTSESRLPLALDTLRRSTPPPVARICEQPRSSACGLLRERLFQLWPACPGLRQEMLGISGKGVAMSLQAEQIEPLAEHHEEIGIAGERHPTRHVDRVVAAELRGIDFRMCQKGGAIALVVEAPHRAGFQGLVVRQAQHGLILDEIGHGVESIDGETRKARGHHPFGSRGAG